MTHVNLLNLIRLLIVLVICFGGTSCSHKQAAVSEQPPKRALTAEDVAKTYGLDSFGEIEGIRYTWNAQFPGVNISRAWTWEPKTGQVSYEGKDKDGKPVKATYIRSQLNSQPENVKNELEPAFVNDNYWLLFPLHAFWDSSATVTDQGLKQLPIGSGSARLLSVKYPADGGYTPGDTWDLFIGNDDRVEQMVYHRGGPKKPSLVTVEWAGYKKAGPLLISTEHKGTADGNQIRIFITDVAVKVAGSKDWINAQ